MLISYDHHVHSYKYIQLQMLNENCYKYRKEGELQNVLVWPTFKIWPNIRILRKDLFVRLRTFHRSLYMFLHSHIFLLNKSTHRGTLVYLTFLVTQTSLINEFDLYNRINDRNFASDESKLSKYQEIHTRK